MLVPVPMQPVIESVSRADGVLWRQKIIVAKRAANGMVFGRGVKSFGPKVHCEIFSHFFDAG